MCDGKGDERGCASFDYICYIYIYIQRTLTHEPGPYCTQEVLLYMPFAVVAAAFPSRRAMPLIHVFCV